MSEWNFLANVTCLCPSSHFTLSWWLTYFYSPSFTLSVSSFSVNCLTRSVCCERVNIFHLLFTRLLVDWLCLIVREICRKSVQTLHKCHSQFNWLGSLSLLWTRKKRFNLSYLVFFYSFHSLHHSSLAIFVSCRNFSSTTNLLTPSPSRSLSLTLSRHCLMFITKLTSVLFLSFQTPHSLVDVWGWLLFHLKSATVAHPSLFLCVSFLPQPVPLTQQAPNL